jgi:hypothetical protein
MKTLAQTRIRTQTVSKLVKIVLWLDKGLQMTMTVAAVKKRKTTRAEVITPALVTMNQMKNMAVKDATTI